MDAVNEKEIRETLTAIIVSCVALVVIETLLKSCGIDENKEGHMKIELTKPEVLRVVNSRAFVKALECKGKGAKVKSALLNAAVIWGVVGTLVGIIGIIVPNGGEEYLTSISGYILATGVLCIPLGLRVWKRYKKEKRSILNALSAEEKKANRE